MTVAKNLLVAANPPKVHHCFPSESISKMMKMTVMIIKHLIKQAVTVWCQKHWREGLCC